MERSTLRGFRRIKVTDHDETRWMFVGPHGALDFHCQNVDALAKLRRLDGLSRLDRLGGIESHYRTAPEYMRADAPSHEHCWVLGGKCWHDGSSLWASEHWIPLLEACGEEAIWAELERQYAQRFAPIEAVVEAQG